MAVCQLLKAIVGFVVWASVATSCFAQQGSRYIRDLGNDTPVIIFLHGVLGDARSTWTNGSAYWPDLLVHDDVFAGTSIYVHEYKTTFRGGGLSVNELAEDLKARLDADKASQHNQLIFIAHSMGGLVARDFLLKYRDLATKTRFIFFLATPTTGAAIANWAELVSRNPQFADMRLMNSSEYLTNIQRDWIAAEFATKIPSYCAYEIESTSYGLLRKKVVDQASASSLCNKPPLLAVEVDHIGIAKPADRRAVQYQVFATAFLNETTTSKLALVDRGFAYLSEKQWDQALKFFEEAIRIDPDYVPAIKNRGAVFLERQDWNRAIKDYDKAIQLEPEYAEHFCNRGVAYFGRLDYDRAIADFTTAVRLDFYDKPFALYFRGKAKQQKGDLAGAGADMDQARGLDAKIDERVQ